MKKILVLVLTMCLVFSATASYPASAASVSWTPEEISDELQTEIYDAYTAYQYGQELKYLTNLGKPIPSYEEYAEKHKMEDITFFACMAKDESTYLLYINAMPEDDFYVGFGYDRAGNYLFDINKHGGTQEVYVYYKALSDWGFAPLDEALQTGRISAEKLNALLAGRIGDLAPFVYSVNDVDKNGTVSVSDVIELRQGILRGYVKYAVSTYDIDGDGEVTVSDVIALRAMIVG